RETAGGGVGARRRHRHAEQRVRPQPALRGRAVERDQGVVERALGVELATALRTPLPPYRRGSPSRSSSASRSPVEAPDGTAARPAPPSTIMSTSTVG